MLFGVSNSNADAVCAAGRDADGRRADVESDELDAVVAPGHWEWARSLRYERAAPVTAVLYVSC
jgi:hypothetical protein